MLNNLFSNVNVLSKALDGSWMRAEAISNNISNINTPGYKRVTVDFENILMSELENKKISLSTTHSKHINMNNNGNKPFVKKDTASKTQRDGNNVNIDVETANLAKNTIMYNALSKQISKKFENIETVIREGGK